MKHYLLQGIAWAEPDGYTNIAINIKVTDFHAAYAQAMRELEVLHVPGHPAEIMSIQRRTDKE